MQAVFMILVSLVLIANGVLLLYSPDKYFATLNRVTRWTSGPQYWAQFSPELTRPFSVRLMFRLGGAFFVFMGVNLFILGVAAAAAWLRGEPWRSVAPEGRAGPATPVIPFLLLMCTGFVLILFPRQLIRRFGTHRFYVGREATIQPLVSGFRLIGAICIGIAVSMLVGWE